ncbi:hypothetical protein JCM8208_001910 [Rhodotorula glutinis]
MAEPRAHTRRMLEESRAESSTMAQNRNPRRDDDPFDMTGLEERMIDEYLRVGIDIIDKRNAATKAASRQVLGDVIEDSMSGRDVEPPSPKANRAPTPEEVVERKIRAFKKRLADPRLDDQTRTELTETLRVHEEALAERREKKEFLLDYGAQWKKHYEHTEWIQKGWDTPTPEIGKLWLRRHRILDSPYTGKYHWREGAVGKRAPATTAAKAEVAAINKELEPLLKAWKKEKGKTTLEMCKVENGWNYAQSLIDHSWTIYKIMERDYAEALVEPIDCSPPPPPPPPGHRRRFLNFVKDILPRRSTADSSKSDAHSLGVGEGSYRMRRRYFGERY